MNERNDAELCELRRAWFGDGQKLRRIDEVLSLKDLANRLADIQAAARDAEQRCNDLLFPKER